MPWTKKSAKRFTKKASTPRKRKAWAKIANKVLKRGGSDKSAIRIANAAVKRVGKRKKRK